MKGVIYTKDALRFLDEADVQYTQPLVLDKALSVRQYVTYMLARTAEMFEWENLPDTIPGYMLERYLQTHGAVTICEAEPKETQYRLGGTKSGVYAFRAVFTDFPDIYLRPTGCVVANPALEQSLNLTIGKDCEIIKNDSYCIGLLPLHYRFAEQLAENDVSIRSAQINSRIRTVIGAGTDREKESAEEYLKQIEAGEIGIIAENPFLEGVKVHQAGSAPPNAIIQFIELQQYLKASWFNEIGLNTNFNMKREYLSSEEIAANTDILLPLVDDMLHNRETACERINAMFGLNISVHKNSAWENKTRESEAEIEVMENEAGKEDSDDKEQPSDSSD